MARKTSLRDFQSYLADRLRSAAAGEASQSWLAVQAGSQRWLIDLTEGGEVIQAPVIHPVPLTQPWFAGVANIRGNLFSVTDLSAFCDDIPTPTSAPSSLLLIGARFGSNAALLIHRVLGLRPQSEFTLSTHAMDQPDWAKERYQDRHGNIWRHLAVSQLLADPKFMNIAN